MSPLSAPVLGAAALVSAPAVWSTFVEQTSPPSLALTRFLVSVLLCWLALEAVALLVGPAPAASPEPGSDAPAVDVPDPAEVR